MTISELKQIMKEELAKVLQEEFSEINEITRYEKETGKSLMNLHKR